MAPASPPRSTSSRAAAAARNGAKPKRSPRRRMPGSCSNGTPRSSARDTLGMTTAALGRLVGADGPMDADALIALDPVPLALSDSGVLALAPAAAPLVVNTQALANASAAAVRASETQYLPTISLCAGYNWSNDGRLTGSLRSGWIVALSTSFPLFNGFVREATVTQAKVAAEVATSTSADAKRFVRAEAQRLL